MSGWRDRLKGPISLALLVQLGIILFTIPSGSISVDFGIRSLSVGGSVHKTFPLFLLTWAVYLALRKQKIRWGVFTAPLFFLGAVTLFSAASSFNPHDSIREGFRLLLCTGFYVALVSLPWHETRFRNSLICFLIGTWVLAARIGISLLASDTYRPTGVHGHPNTIGSLCVLILIGVLLFAELVSDRRWLLLLRLTGGLAGISILFTLSRTAYAAALAGVGFLAVFGGEKTRRSLWPTVLAAAIVLIFQWKPITNRLRETGVDLRGERPESRLAIWDVTFQNSLSDLPLTAWGAKTGFTEVTGAREMVRTDRPPAPRLAHPHNQLLDILTGTGLPGLVGWVWLAVALIAHIHREEKSFPPDTTPYFAAVLISVCVISLSEANLTSRNIFPALVMMLALADLLPRYHALPSGNAQEQIPGDSLG